MSDTIKDVMILAGIVGAVILLTWLSYEVVPLLHAILTGGSPNVRPVI
jgi:hypothetical protein